MLLDVDRARRLAQSLAAAADTLDRIAPQLRRLLDEAAALAGLAPSDVPGVVLQAARDLSADAHELAKRVVTVEWGGPDINAILWSLDRVRRRFSTIDGRGDPSSIDGHTSAADLRWARDNLDDDTADAAAWLLDHPHVLAAMARADGDRDYLADPYRERFVSPVTPWAPSSFSHADLDAFESHLATWIALVPHLSTLDVAAGGGAPDGVVSRDDITALLADCDLPPEVTDALRAALADGAWHDTGLTGADVAQALSFVPVVGDAADAALALHYLSQGDYVAALAYGVGVAPIPGVSGSGVKAATKVVDEVSTIATREGVEAAAGSFARSTARAGGRQAVGTMASDVVEDATGNPYLAAIAGTTTKHAVSTSPTRAFERELAKSLALAHRQRQPDDKPRHEPKPR